jgi:hypothetical protein
LWPPIRVAVLRGCAPNVPEQRDIREHGVTSIFLRDIVRGLRSWRRTPGSALLVVLALGMSGGALIALVNLVNSVFWREVPVARPEELVGISRV